MREKYCWADWNWRLELEWCERKVLLGWSWSNKPNAVIDIYGVVKMSEKRFTMSFIECYSVTISTLEGAYAVLVQGKFLPKSSSESLEWRC